MDVDSAAARSVEALSIGAARRVPPPRAAQDALLDKPAL